MKMFDIYEKLAYGNLNKESLGYVNKPDNIFTDAYEKFTTKDFPRLKEAEKEIQEEYGDYLENIQETLGVLIMRLKQHYNRARPYQVAYYTNQNLHPFFTASGNTPAYPSGHAAQGRFLCKVIAHHYPEKGKDLLKLSHKIANSRIALGVHFPTDNKFGFEIADTLATIPAIRGKYFK